MARRVCIKMWSKKKIKMFWYVIACHLKCKFCLNVVKQLFLKYCRIIVKANCNNFHNLNGYYKFYFIYYDQWNRKKKKKIC